MTGTPGEVARRHLAAVEAGDPAQMAADYAVDAELHRPGEVHRGRVAIEAYFRSVPERLGDSWVVFDQLVVDGDTAVFRWHLAGGSASGTDRLTIRGGRIVHQLVQLDSEDF